MSRRMGALGFTYATQTLCLISTSTSSARRYSVLTFLKRPVPCHSSEYSRAMSRNSLNVAVDIGAPPEKVFGVLCDVERWPEWTPTMTSVQRLDNGPFGVGSSAQVRQPRLRPAVWQGTNLEDGRNFT